MDMTVSFARRLRGVAELYGFPTMDEEIVFGVTGRAEKDGWPLAHTSSLVERVRQREGWSRDVGSGE